MFERPASRRQFLSGIVGGAAALSLRPFVQASNTAPSMPVEAVAPTVKWAGPLPTKHLAWVWQFNQDGEPERIRETLAQHGLGIAMKTHDGTNWMSKWDTSRNALSGPQQIAKIASFFEAGGVPFHAWCVVKGNDPMIEASMAASVIASGARSLSIALESYPGFWTGTQFDALVHRPAAQRPARRNDHDDDRRASVGVRPHPDQGVRGRLERHRAAGVLE